MREGAGLVRGVTAARKSVGVGRTVRFAAAVDVVRGAGGARLWRPWDGVG